MKTLNEMKSLTRSQLETIAMSAANRQYSIACTQMVAAMDAHALGDVAVRNAHIERAKTAWTRANEDERGQVARVLETQAVVVERGAAVSLANKGVASAPVRTSYTINNWIGGSK